MAKPKKSEHDVVYPVSDRYLSIYANWQDFVTEYIRDYPQAAIEVVSE